MRWTSWNVSDLQQLLIYVHLIYISFFFLILKPTEKKIKN